MKKHEIRKYGINLSITEYYDGEDITAVNLLDYFELTTKENIPEVLGFFKENLLMYLGKHI